MKRRTFAACIPGLIHTLRGSEYPGKSWDRVSAAQAGFVPARFEKLAFAEKETRSAATVIIVNGRVAAAWGQPEKVFPCHSVRKSFVSALYGRAVAEGKIRLDATLEDLGIDDRAALSADEKRATVRHLLMARSGVYLRSNLASEEMLRNLPRRGSHPPGAHWYYNNWDFNALGTIYERQTGVDVFRAFETQIARPIGMEHFRREEHTIWSDTKESAHRGYEFRLSALDMGRFGWLMLNRGYWRDLSVVPATWVDESTRTHSRVPGKP